MRNTSAMPNRSLPAVYADVDVRCVLPYAPNRARFGIGLNLPDEVIRYAVDVAGARFLRDALDRALKDYEAKCGVQSARSSESPKSSGLPHEGQSHVPPARSSSACCAVLYSPSASSCHTGCQKPERSNRIQKVPAVLAWLYATIRAMVLSFGCGWGAKRPFSAADGEVVCAVREFAFAPGGRLRCNGALSGQEFRESVVEPAVWSGLRVVVDLDGVLGYSSAFLEELFGGLVRSMGCTSSEEFGRRVRIRSSVESWRVEAKGYVRDALAKQAGEGAHA